jgi:hypothetical protein
MHHARTFGAAAIISLFALAAPAMADTATPAQPQGTTQAAPQATQGAQRTAPAAPVTDAELRNFAAARAQIEPLNARPQTTDAERQAALTEMRAVLQRNNLTGARYNEIVAAVQADPALQQRLAALTPRRSPTG